MKFTHTLTIAVILVAANLASAQTVFHYSYNASDPFPTIVDISGAGNNAFAGELAFLSTDVPTTGVPAGSGDRSFDSSDPTAIQGFESGAVTDQILLLENFDIEAAGGFTFETWFKWNGGGAVNSIIDYAGTDKFVIDQRFGASTEMAMRMDPVDYPLGEVTAGEWHYAAFTFDSTGNTVDGNLAIEGLATGYFDGLTPIDLGVATKSDFGDSLARPFGIGQHPIGFDLDYFDGTVYETRVSLGALSPEELLFEGGPLSADGDFDDDGDYDCDDINALTSAIAAGANDIAFDLDGDEAVDLADRDAWLAEAGAVNLASGNPYKLGDANLDGVVDVSDFGVWNANKFTTNDAWCEGDFTADGVVDVGDFNEWNGNKFTSSDAAAVPEPGSMIMLLVLSAGLLRFRK
ncbi:MAG: LamG-like jellyroll fold domain-containing protein [Planctomycetota bacterium]